jgi:branched-chain amino acid transport system permease protein
LLAFIAMIVLGIATERIVLRPLVNQPHHAVHGHHRPHLPRRGRRPDGVGANVRGLDLGIVDEPIAWLMDNYEIGVSKFDLFAAGVAASLVALLALLFQYTKVGRPCGRWRTTTRRRCRSASRCRRSGAWCGRWRASWRWWPG